MGRLIMYSPEVRERAVRMVSEHRGEHRWEWAAICSIAEKFGCSSETLRKWVRRAETDQGLRHLLTNPTPTPHSNDLRLQRHQARQTLTDVAQQLQVHPTLISLLERGLHHNHQLATRYQQWLTDTTRNPIWRT